MRQTVGGIPRLWFINNLNEPVQVHWCIGVCCVPTRVALLSELFLQEYGHLRGPILDDHRSEAGNSNEASGLVAYERLSAGELDCRLAGMAMRYRGAKFNFNGNPTAIGFDLLGWTCWALNGEDSYGLPDSNCDPTPTSAAKQSLLQGIQ